MWALGDVWCKKGGVGGVRGASGVSRGVNGIGARRHPPRWSKLWCKRFINTACHRQSQVEEWVKERRGGREEGTHGCDELGLDRKVSEGRSGRGRGAYLDEL